MGLRFAVFRSRQNVGLEDFERGGRLQTIVGVLMVVGRLKCTTSAEV